VSLLLYSARELASELKDALVYSIATRMSDLFIQLQKNRRKPPLTAS